MSDHNPIVLTAKEWDEVAAVADVRRLWGLEGDDSGEALTCVAYGAKFNVVSGGPGFVGELFVIADDALGGTPVPLVRNTHTHKLEVVTF